MEEKKNQKIRTRFAPSPTGFIQMGNLRTALFNYLYAKQHNGDFVLRIEDTDKERSKKEYEDDIIDSLNWLGLNWDEGPDTGGKYGPYRQSEKLDVYSKYLENLLDENKAYYCFCSEEDLEAQRQYQLSIGESPHYSGKCASIPKEDAEKMRQEGKPCVIRFRISPKKVKFHDLIRGNVEFDAGLFGDLVIAKDLKTPLYNFSVVIDDYEMKITHVIRGEDHLSNTPKQILLQEALGLTSVVYAHLPIILAPDRTKLSKRHGAVSIESCRREGYLPEAIINFIAFLGWNPGGEKEIYSLPDLVNEFKIEKVQKAGAIFNVQRLDYLNGFYIRHIPIEKLAQYCFPYLVEAGLIFPEFKTTQYPPAYGAKEVSQTFKSAAGQNMEIKNLQKIIALYKERLKKLSEISELSDFFFKDELEYDKDLLRWKQMEDSELKSALGEVEDVFSKIEKKEWSKNNLEKEIMPKAEQAGDRGRLLWPLRAALTGKKASPGPFEVAEIIGKEKSLARIADAKNLLPGSENKN